MARGFLISLGVCLALVGCGSDSGTSGTVAQQPKTCAQLRRQMEAKQGKGGGFECSIKGHKIDGTYSTGKLTFPHGRGKHR